MAQFLLDGARTLGGGWRDVFGADALSTAFHGQTGVVLIARIVVLLATAAVMRRIIKRSAEIPT